MAGEAHFGYEAFLDHDRYGKPEYFPSAYAAAAEVECAFAGNHAEAQRQIISAAPSAGRGWTSASPRGCLSSALRARTHVNIRKTNPVTH